MKTKQSAWSIAVAVSTGLLAACAMSTEQDPSPAANEPASTTEQSLAAIPKLTDDGSGCYGACGSGCNFCYGSQVTLPYACPDGSTGSITKNRLICPTAQCCVDHDGCFRGCGLDPECQLGCNSIAVTAGCLPALVGDPVPGESWIVQREDDYVTCNGKTTPKKDVPIAQPVQQRVD